MNSYCACGNRIEHCSEDDLITCMNCGIVHGRTLLTDVTHSSYTQSFSKTLVVMYSRSKRFKNMLEQIVCARYSQSDETVLRTIGNKKFETINELLLFMKTMNCRDKRYNSIHLLAKHCVKKKKKLQILKK